MSGKKFIAGRKRSCISQRKKATLDACMLPKRATDAIFKFLSTLTKIT